MKKVSIIIPIYNSENYIEKCVESIVNQSYRNIEIILINDGSTDNSLEKIKKLSIKHSNIRFFDQKNHGVSYSRNKGIQYASGEYVMFVDNDDYIDEDYVEVFVKSIEKGNYDYVIGGYKRVDVNDKILMKKVFKDEKWSFYMFITPWGKIFNRKFLLDNKIEFLKVKMGEDIYFNVLAISYSDKSTVINYAGYNWLYNEESVSNTIHTKNTDSNKKDLLFLFDKILQNINNSYYEKNKIYVKYFFLKTIIWYTLYSCKNMDTSVVCCNYFDLKKYISDNISNCYEGIIKFNPKGESFRTKFIIIIFIILDKLSLLKFFISFYSKI